MDPFTAAATTGPAWIVSPRAARPGEVVHVRLKFKPTVGTTGRRSSRRSSSRSSMTCATRLQGQLYVAEGTFGVDLLVPPGTDWGSDPIVWALSDIKTSIATTPSRFLLSAPATRPSRSSRRAAPSRRSGTADPQTPPEVLLRIRGTLPPSAKLALGQTEAPVDGS